MEKLSPEQFKRWKTNKVGSLFFKYLEESIEWNNIQLKNTLENPSAYSQEDYYKKSMEASIVNRTMQGIIDLKIDTIYEGMEIEDETTE